MKKLIVVSIITLLFFCFTYKKANKVLINTNSKPTISFTFDDGNIADMPNYKLEEWNELLLKNLKKNQLKSILFSKGNNKTGEKGAYLLNSWNKAGHRIANHTMTHPNCNKISLQEFENELISNDAIIKQYSNYLPFFRFPYLKEGNTKEKIDGFRTILSKNGYKNGHVSIDASDWYIDARLVNRLKENPKADIKAFKDFYIQHLYERAIYYENLSVKLTGRHINHVLLLHHNLAAALFLDDLINYFKAKGWNIINADKAFQDKIYETNPTNIPAGESLLWALAKQSGKFEKELRYPAESDEYEKDKMDKLGL